MGVFVGLCVGAVLLLGLIICIVAEIVVLTTKNRILQSQIHDLARSGDILADYYDNAEKEKRDARAAAANTQVPRP